MITKQLQQLHCMNSSKENIKLFQLLASIKTKELERFMQFLHSPYFNREAFYPRLLEELIAFHPAYKQVDKFLIFQKILPKQSITADLINERFSKMSRLVEQFLLQEEFKKQQALKEELQLTTYQNRRLPKWFNHVAKLRIKRFKTQYPSTATPTLSHWLTYHYLQNYPEAAMVFNVSHPQAFPLHLLDEYYFLHKLRHACNFLARESFFNESNPIPLLKDILQYIEQHYPTHPIIQYYYNLVQLHLEWETTSFQNLVDEFYLIYTKLEQNDQLFILLNMVNLALKQINRGHSALISTAFELYQFSIQDELFLKKSPLTESTFLNICTFGAYQQAFEWTNKFIETHKHLLTSASSYPTIILGKALLLFHAKHYQEAILLFHEIMPNRFAYKLRMRSLYVRSLLGLHLKKPTFYKSLKSGLNAFNQYLNRNKELSKEKKEAYRNMNKAILQIAQLRQHGWGNRQQHIALSNWMDTLEKITAKAWLKSLIEI